MGDDRAVHNVFIGTVFGTLVQGRDINATAPAPENSGPVGRPVREADPFALEVHQSIAAPGCPALPSYVPRGHDTRLRDVVASAVDGRSALAVLVGGSSTGKTRACWEALSLVPDSWRLWHPIDPGRPEAALAELRRITPHTVVWLNESHHYLRADPLGEYVAAGLRGLLRNPERGPVLILGTTWPEHWRALTADPTGRHDPHAQARMLLTGNDITVPDSFTSTDLDAVRSADDPRLAEAVAKAPDGQITQFLAGVPALLERYRNAQPGERALLNAAIDARRLGHGVTMSRAFLEAAAHGYLTDQQWNNLPDDWLDQAFKQVSTPNRGADGPLTRLRPRPGAATEPRYRLADYLEQTGRATRGSVVLPGSFWDAVVAHADRQDLVRLGGAAESRRLYRHAFLCYDAGVPGAPERIARMLGGLGRSQEAVDWLHARAERGDVDAMYWEGVVWESFHSHIEVGSDIDWGPYDWGYPANALESYTRAGRAGHRRAVQEAARLFRELGRYDEGVEWLLPRVDTEDTDELEELAGLLEEVGRDEEAQRFQERSDAIYDRWGAERETTRKQTLARLRPVADAGDPEAARTVGRLLWGVLVSERDPAAIDYLRHAAEAGADDEAWSTVANEMSQDDAITWLWQGVHAGHEAALFPLGLRLQRAGRHSEAADCFRRAFAAGHAHAAGSLTQLCTERAEELASAGRVDDAIAWLQSRVDDDTPALRALLGRYLHTAGRVAETRDVVASLLARAEEGDAGALLPAADLLYLLGDREEAKATQRWATRAGVPDHSFPRLFRDDVGEYGLEPDGSASAPWSVSSATSGDSQV